MQSHMDALVGDGELCEIYKQMSNYINQNR